MIQVASSRGAGAAAAPLPSRAAAPPAGADPAESAKHIISIAVTTEAALVAAHAAGEVGADACGGRYPGFTQGSGIVHLRALPDTSRSFLITDRSLIDRPSGHSFEADIGDLPDARGKTSASRFQKRTGITREWVMIPRREPKGCRGQGFIILSQGVPDDAGNKRPSQEPEADITPHAAASRSPSSRVGDCL
jgi:hypothetical protein